MNSVKTLNKILKHNHNLFYGNITAPTVESHSIYDLLGAIFDDPSEKDSDAVTILREFCQPPNTEAWDVLCHTQTMKGMKPFIDRLVAPTDVRPIVFFSGGLESTFMAIACPTARFVHVPDVLEFTEDLVLPIAEPLFALMARALGATSFFTGQEFMPEENVPDHLTHCANNWMPMWASYCGVTQISPVVWAEKYDLYKRAHDLGMIWYSCDDRDGDYCTECFKCFQMNAFGRFSGKPLVDFVGDPKPFILQHQQYLKTGQDEYMGDNNTFAYAEQQTGKSISEIFKD